MSTVSYNPDTITREWLLIDLEGQTLGRVSSRVAAILRGKHKPTYTPNADCGDFVVCINAGKMKLTGRKLEQKQYHRHTGYIGGLKTVSAETMYNDHADKMFEMAVKGMLPKGPLGRRMFKKLKVYSGSEHPHQAQEPKPTVVTK